MFAWVIIITLVLACTPPCVGFGVPGAVGPTRLTRLARPSRPSTAHTRGCSTTMRMVPLPSKQVRPLVPRQVSPAQWASYWGNNPTERVQKVPLSLPCVTPSSHAPSPTRSSPLASS